MLRGETACCMQRYRDPFSGALTKLRKPTTTYAMAVRPSLQPNGTTRLAPYGSDIREILYCGAL